ncbi:hypothetical protein GPX89_10085 [Nocardia sp. ET3-3]|uniref:Uncharacterized protein n=1 Tax=Nocardia terrae TaxID=2675851 RepID=A0A7K1UTA7_9NOCA|nr:hypothetical protein [Nocardia terrae]MVU77587.1 hypothetical protein [Nocardia terrae]
MITSFPGGSDLDRAEQEILVYDADHDIGLDATALDPPTERFRPALDSADLADRIDQAWITPDTEDDDDDYLAG